MATPRVALVCLEEHAPVDLRNWLEIALAAPMLRAHAIEPEVILLKAPRHREALLAQWERRMPNLIFMPVPRDQLHSARALLDALSRLRRRDAAPNVAVGGVMGTLATHEFSAHEAVTAILLGDWLETLEEFAVAVSDNKQPREIPGLWWRSPDGWILSQQRKKLRTISELPMPDLSVFRVKDLLKVTGGAIPILASRGFPFRSLFSAQPLLRHLQESENYYESLDPAEVIRNAERQLNQHGPRRFVFVDELFPWNPRWVREFATQWAQRVALPFSINTAAEHMTAEAMRTLAGAGLKRVRLHLESGNDQFRARYSDLNVTNPAVRTAVSTAQRERVQVEARLLLGIPDENRDTIAQTVEFARTLLADGYAPEVFLPWPRTTQWTETNPMPTIVTEYVCQPALDNEALREPLQNAFDTIMEMDSLARASRHARNPNAILDAMADFQLATVRSPLRRPIRIATFHTQEGETDTIALRVPSELRWKIKMTPHATIHFGILIEPALPGLRTRLPVSFSLKLGQKGSYFRLFQKVLMQALDPDSRRWHFFQLPLKPSEPGDAELIFEATVFGRGGDFIPPEGDIWAGWAKVRVIDQAPSTAMDSAIFEIPESEP